MRKKSLIPNLIFVFGLMVSIYIICNPFLVGQSFVPWGIVADDESVIQPFITSKTQGKDFRIPQDMDTLDIDYFYLYLEWRGSLTSRELVIQLLEQKEREIIIGDQVTVEIIWEIYDEQVISMVKGINEWNDPRFSLKRIDNNVISGFKKAEAREKIRILYRDIEIEFFHFTSYAEMEQTKTIQQWNTEAIMLAGWTIFLSFMAGGASRWILNKATYVPNLPHWSIWVLIFLVIVVSTILFFLIAGYNLDEVLRVVVLIPAPIVSICFSIYLAFWLAAKFRPKKLLELLFFIIDIPSLDDVKSGKRTLRDENELPIDGIVKKGYLNENGEIELVNDPDSYWETVRRIKMGGIKFKIKKFGKRIRIKQKLKNFDDIIICDSYQEQDLKVNIKSGALYSVSSVIIIIGVFTWILPLFLSIASVITSILGTLFIVIGAGFFFWENVDISAPLVEVSPITDKSAITIMRDRLSLDMKNEEIADLEMELYKEKTEISKRARQQSLKALTLIENALLPLAELSQEELIDVEDLPDQLKIFIKKWVENWKNDASMEDMKQVVQENLKENKKE